MVRHQNNKNIINAISHEFGVLFHDTLPKVGHDINNAVANVTHKVEAIGHDLHEDVKIKHLKFYKQQVKELAIYYQYPHHCY